MEALALEQYTNSSNISTPQGSITTIQSSVPHHPQTVLQNAFNDVFATNSELDNNVTRTRRLLGATVQTLTDEQIEVIVSEFQFLIRVWMDEFEKELFNGMTLQEVINNT